MEQLYQESQQSDQAPDKKNNETMEWVKAIVIAVGLVLVIRWLLFAPFIVDGPSMHPNFSTGERIIVNKVIYDIRKPKPGEVIVFHVPSEGRDFIKRVIAVPGDTVKVQGDTVTVNGKPIDEPYIKEAVEAKHKNNELYNDKDFPNEDVQDGTVPEGHLFVMGDNRSDSRDSRMIGYIPYKDVVGRADLVFWPFNKVHFIKH
ncbi:signal peptidase I [Paenibacillus caui]|uniref:signal peptidase I n=1 Tax=Paenibacillus caui TaxID=2873927 RepID=UPI001CA7EE3D|nr:signal peptidase I [Paenibacillus caui]